MNGSSRRRLLGPVSRCGVVNHPTHLGSWIDVRTLAAARRTGGDPVQLMWNDNHRRTRRVVMLADVSGSMQTFVRPYMHVLRALSHPCRRRGIRVLHHNHSHHAGTASVRPDRGCCCSIGVGRRSVFWHQDRNEFSDAHVPMPAGLRCCVARWF